MKKFIRPLTYMLIAAIPLGLMVGFATPWHKKNAILCVGSSAVKTFIEEFAKDYPGVRDESNNLIETDITVEAGGSGLGISDVSKGFASIGNASKNPFFDIKKENHKPGWTQRNIKTVTVAWEAICLLYIPPKELPDEYKNFDKLSELLNIDEDNIEDLFWNFSGFKKNHDDHNKKKPSMSFLFDQSIIGNLELKKYFDDQELTPYVRTGGAHVSGTAASFFNDHHIKDQSEIERNLTEDVKNAFISGNYGKDYEVIQTDEANSRAWDIFSRNNIPGSVVYLSSGFVEKNLALIEKSHYGVIKYKKNKYQMSQVGLLYDWVRPINLMFSIGNQETLNANEISTPARFVEYLIAFGTNYDDAEKAQREARWESLGAKMISEKQIKSMSINQEIDKFWTADYKLKETRTEDLFGALYVK